MTRRRKIFLCSLKSISGYLFFLFFVLLCSYNLYATEDFTGDALRELERRQRQTEQRLSERGRAEKEKEPQEAEKSQENSKEEGNTFFVKKIIIKNDELLSKSEKEKVLSQYEGKNIGYNDINILVRVITNLLINRGYITARVKIPLSQDLSTGELTLVIVNGYIEKITPKENSSGKRRQIFFAFPLMEGGLLNIKDLDYGVEQMNRLPSNDVRMKVRPGSKAGMSNILITNKQSGRLNLSLGYDNLGQKTTGVYRGKVTAGFDNLLNINDMLSFDYTHTVSDRKRHFSRSGTFFYSFPFGYWMFSLTYSRSEYKQYIAGLKTDFKTSGKDSSKVVVIDKILWRYRYNKLKLKTSLALKNKENFIEDSKIDSSSRKLTIGKLGFDYSTFVYKGYFSSNIFYYRGLNVFDAHKDSPNLEKDVPRAQFNKLDFSLLWNKSFALFGRHFNYAINLGGQYGFETLYGSEKISIGDLYSVRGFKNSSISGDRGFKIRNDLAITDLTFLTKYMKGVRFFVAHDYGYVVERVGREANGETGEGSIMGIACGLNYSSGIVNGNLTCAHKLLEPWFINEDDFVVYFSLSLGLTSSFNALRDVL